MFSGHSPEPYSVIHSEPYLSEDVLLNPNQVPPKHLTQTDLVLCIYLSDNLLESSNVSNSHVRMFCGYLLVISLVIVQIDVYTDGLEM